MTTGGSGKPRAIVVGGGIDATVHERAAMLGDVGAGLVLWSNAMRVLRRLGLADDVIRRPGRQ